MKQIIDSHLCSRRTTAFEACKSVGRDPQPGRRVAASLRVPPLTSALNPGRSQGNQTANDNVTIHRQQRIGACFEACSNLTVDRTLVLHPAINPKPWIAAHLLRRLQLLLRVQLTQALLLPLLLLGSLQAAAQGTVRANAHLDTSWHHRQQHAAAVRQLPSSCAASARLHTHTFIG